MLVLSSVSVRFGGLQVLDKVSLSVPECGIFGLIGPNGAGKTTVFNLVTGLLSPNSGAIEFMGQRMNGMLPHQITRSGIARTFQNIRIFKEMKLVENVLVALGARSTYAAGAWLRLTSSHDGERQDREVARALLARVGLSDKAERYAETLSYGEQRRLEIARALATRFLRPLPYPRADEGRRHSAHHPRRARLHARADQGSRTAHPVAACRRAAPGAGRRGHFQPASLDLEALYA